MKTETLRRLALVAMTAALVPSLFIARSVHGAQSIHVWTDESGRTHYSNRSEGRPPARTLEAPPLPTTEEGAAARQRAERAHEELRKWESSRETVIVVDESARVSCDRALRIVDFLREYPELPVLRPHDDGQVTLMDETRRREVLDRAQADLRQRCLFATDVDMDELWTGLFWPRTSRTARILPTQFLPRPVIQEPTAELRAGRPRTTPASPTTSVIGARRPGAPASPASGITGSRPPAAASGAGGVSLR